MLSPMPIFSQKDLESISLIRTGSGFALKAFHASHNIDVSVKLLTSQNVPESIRIYYKRNDYMKIQQAEALLQEVSGVRRLQSDKLLPPLGICKFKGLLGVGTQWMHNGSLNSLIHEHDLYPELPFCLCVRILSDVAESLTYLHGLEPPVLHHCLKPSNVLLDLEYRAKISDYGLATYRRQQLRSLLQTGNNRNSWDLLCLSPEILQGSPFSQEGDVYSFGMMCWETISRQKPLQGKKTFLEAVSGICSGVRPGIEPEFIPNCLPHRNKFLRLLLLCWHQDPCHRPRATECRTFLRNILGTFQKEMIPHAIYNLIHAKDCAVAAAKGPVSHVLETGLRNLEAACPQNNNRPNKEITLTAQSFPSSRPERDPGRPKTDTKQMALANDTLPKTPLGKVPEVWQQPLPHLQKEPKISSPCGDLQKNCPEDSFTDPCCKEQSCSVLISGREAILSCMTEGRLNHLLDVLRSLQLLSRADYEAITSRSTLTGRSRALLDTCVGLGGQAAQTVAAVLSARNWNPLLQHQ